MCNTILCDCVLATETFDLLPVQNSYTVGVGEAFKLHIHADHPVLCEVVYRVEAFSPASSVIRTNEDGAHISLDTSHKEAHYFNITAEDECGHVVTQMYNVFVLPGGKIPMSGENRIAKSSKKRVGRNCKGQLVPLWGFVGMILYSY